MTGTDISMKMLFQSFGKDVLEYLMATGHLPIINILNIHSLQTEHPHQKDLTDKSHLFRADEVLAIQTDDHDIIIQAEFQDRNDSTIPWRMLRYVADTAEIHQETIYPIVLWITPHDHLPSSHIDRSNAMMTFRFTYQNCFLWELPLTGTPYDPGLGELLLTPLILHGHNLSPDIYIAYLEPSITALFQKTQSDPSHQGTAALLLYAFARYHLSHIRAAGYTMYMDILFKLMQKAGFDMDPIRAVVADIAAEGKAEGLAEGLAEGRFQTLEAILPDLNTLSDRQAHVLLQKLGALSVEQYKTMIRQLRDFPRAQSADLDHILENISK